MIQKEAVHTPKAVIMEKMDYGDMELKSSRIDRRRQTRDDVVDLPKVELSKLVVPPQLPGDLGIMKGPEGGGEATEGPRSQKILGRAKEVFHRMLFLQSIPNPKDRGFLTAVVDVAVEDLEDFQPPHRYEFIGGWS